MTTGEFEYFSHESLLFITKKGCLKRLKTPFKALLIVQVGELKENETYLVTHVIMSVEEIMSYTIRGNPYYYFYFIILG